jgi:hypothetical protein
MIRQRRTLVIHFSILNIQSLFRDTPRVPACLVPQPWHGGLASDPLANHRKNFTNRPPRFSFGRTLRTSSFLDAVIFIPR